MTLLLNILLIAILTSSYGQENKFIKDLQIETKEELIAILQGSLKPKHNCNPPQDSDIQILLYTRQNTHKPIILNPSNPYQLDPDKKLVLIVHGWISGPTYIGMPDIKDAYLKRYDCNLVMIDWSKLAWQAYTTAYCQLPEIGQIVAKFLCSLQDKFDISLQKMHVIGHSMGGQLAGFIGQHVIKECGQKVGRITGLDPAGILYHGVPSSKRLDETDAVFVDVIHTNSLLFGYWPNCGHVDFHVNCGIIQNGCPDFNITNIENVLMAKVICSHVRSIYYMAESTTSNDFKAQNCNNCPFHCNSKNTNATYTIMGENCPRDAPNGAYWLPTKTSSPYAEGCSPYPPECT